MLSNVISRHFLDLHLVKNREVVRSATLWYVLLSVLNKFKAVLSQYAYFPDANKIIVSNVKRMGRVNPDRLLSDGILLEGLVSNGLRA